MIEARKSGRIPDTIGSCAFPTALIGRHRCCRGDRPDYCRSHGIGIVRRITGGGAIYFDEGQLGWELVSTARRWESRPCPTWRAKSRRRLPPG
jgi:lipoate-protein ligase A